MNNSHLEISQKKAALLKWILSFNPQSQISSIDSLPQNPFLASILLQIDADFKSIDPTTLTILETCLQLSKYMVLKLNFKGIVTSHCGSVDSMISQLLYVCVHCDKKEDFITKILALQPQTQSILMRIISQTSLEFEKHKQLKQVLQKVQELQIENQNLKRHIERNQDQFERYEDKIQDLKKEMKSIIDQNTAFRKQKAQVLKELDIIEFDDYLELYKRLANDYQELDLNFKKLNQFFEKQKVQNQEYKKKIIEDSQFIYFLSNQSEEARVKWLTLKSIYSNNPPQSIYDFQINNPSISPQPFTSKCPNILTRKNTNNSENEPPKRQEKEKPTEFIQSNNILQQKAQNLRVVQESQKLQQRCMKYKAIIKQLNLRNRELQNCNGFLFQKMQDLEQVYSNMRDRYSA